MQAEPDTGVKKGDLQTRWVEVVVAALIVVAGLVVIQDSLRVGISWGSDGPKAGYFPFYIGVILAIAGVTVVVQTVLRWRSLASKTFATRSEMKPVLQMLLPTVVYVVAIAFVGIYVASLVFIIGFMILQGKYRWWHAATIAIIVVVGLFMMFEIWFLVPLPKGPLEAWLGY